MTIGKEEAAPIARLLSRGRRRTVGWVYLWNTSELSILWIDRGLPPEHVDPPLRPEILVRAKAVTTDDITALLEGLSAAG